MKIAVSLLCLLAVVLATREDESSSPAFKCRACRFIDAVLLDFEESAGGELRSYLEEKCAMLGILYSECKNIVDQVVDKVEHYGHLLDQDELCTTLLHVCSHTHCSRLF